MHWLVVLLAFTFVSMATFVETDSQVTPFEGAMILESRADFDRLGEQGYLLGTQQISEVKFLVTHVQSDSSKLYFINSCAYDYHWKFNQDVLKSNMDLYGFRAGAYTDTNRQLIAGSLIRFDSFSSAAYPEGVYCIEFWASDPVHAEDASLVFSLLEESMPYASDMLVYHPTGETQVRICLEEKGEFENQGISVIFTSELYNDVGYSALNTGVACGMLVDGRASGNYSHEDIVVFQHIPNDISHVAAVITTVPQTPLSHINLRARQNGTPHVFIQNFTETEEYKTLLGEYVRFTALPGGYTMECIPYSEVVTWFESAGHDSITILQRDLTEQRVRNLSELTIESSIAYGAKAANLGELSQCLPAGSAPQGYAVPFLYYNEFMEYNNIYRMIDSLSTLEEFNQSVESREDMLAQIRTAIEDGSVPLWMMKSFTELALQFESGIPIRCRSSTNNEDLPDFNGAGLYESFTHHAREGHISNSIQQVWASMWTYRAYQERDFHSISHNSSCMGVILHPSFRNETANGVAVTKNIYNRHVTGYYVNVQVGDDMVTNPYAESVPEEFLITRQFPVEGENTEVQYTGFSNRVSEGERVLSHAQIRLLADHLESIHNHFTSVYDVECGNDSDFAMEIEFKILPDGSLIVKQARPWVPGDM